MNFYNTTTGKYRNLSIVDRNTNCQWTADLIGNAGSLIYNDDEERYEMSGDDLDWWENVIEGLENIEDLTEKAKELLDENDFEALERKLSEEGNGSDYEQHISVLTAILEDVIKENTAE